MRPANRKPKHAWDFGAAKGTGASVVPIPEEPELSPNHPTPVRETASPTAPLRRPAKDLVVELNVDPTKALIIARRIGRASLPHEPIPQELRELIAQIVDRATGNTALATNVRQGVFDSHLVELLPEHRQR